MTCLEDQEPLQMCSEVFLDENGYLKSLGTHSEIDIKHDKDIQIKAEPLEVESGESLENINFADIKSEIVAGKIEEEEVFIKSDQEDTSDYQKVDTYVEKIDWIFDNRSNSAGDSQKHIFVHEGSGSLFKCTKCSYHFKKRYCLKQHMLVHENPSQVEVFKCNECSFASKYKYNLKPHMLVHRNPSEVQMFKCTDCSYQCKHKNNLMKHMLRHRDQSEVRIFKCNECTYKSKYKGDLKKHMLIHRDPSHVEVFRCNECSFESTRRQSLKNHLKKHILVHKDTS